MGSSISSLLFQPPPCTFLHPTRHIWLHPTPTTKIPAFHITNGNDITVLFSHGNAEDLGMIYDWFVEFSKVLSVDVFCYDYTGYGKSTGPKPSEENVYRDVLCAYRHLTEVKGVHHTRIVLYGRSLGSGPSCYMAEKASMDSLPVAGVILQSPLLSAYRVAFPFRFTLWGDKFPSVTRMKRITSPVFVIHGTQDEVVPFWHGETLWSTTLPAWRAKPFWVLGAGHNNIEAHLRASGSFVDHIAEFLDIHVPMRTGGKGGRDVVSCVERAIRETTQVEG